jgi:carboxylesterase type B
MSTTTSMLLKGVYELQFQPMGLQTNNVNSIRYAAPPIGKLRFAAPQAPVRNRTSTIAATSNPPFCPQTGASSEIPAAYGFTSALGNEDCLFLNVYAPANAKNLPVFFWIRKYFSQHYLESS